MKVFVNYNDKRWRKYKIDFEKIANAVVGSKYSDSEVSITLTDDEEIHALNKMYRNICKDSLHQIYLFDQEPEDNLLTIRQS